MKTKFPFNIVSDESGFKLEYKELKKNEAKSIAAQFENIKAKIDELEALQNEISFKNEKKEILKELASVKSGDEKANLMAEILTIMAEVEAKTKELKELSNARLDLEVPSKKRFELCVSGEDIEAFKAKVEEAGLSYLSVMNAIDEAVLKEKEKK